MKIERFEDIKAWQLARELVNEIYLLKCKTEDRIDLGYRDQINRAAVSIMSNIAEGFEYRNDKDFIRFLRIAKGSGAEVKSLLYIGEDLGYLSKEKAKVLIGKADEICKIIAGLIKAINKS
jgi:four helix bundle protein